MLLVFEPEVVAGDLEEGLVGAAGDGEGDAGVSCVGVAGGEGHGVLRVLSDGHGGGRLTRTPGSRR